MPNATLKYSPLLSLKSNYKAGEKKQWGRLIGDSFALAIHDQAVQHDGLSLVITPDTQTARQTEAALRFFSCADENIQTLHLPDWETLPYDQFSPHEDIISERLLTLYQLPKLKKGILIVPVNTLMHRLPPTEFVTLNSFVLKPGQTLIIGELRRQLESSGYRCVETVFEHGEFAVRGSLIDIFPMGSRVPYRVDLFDDEVESLRSFEPESQRTIDQLDSIELLPAKEFPLDKSGIAKFRNNWHNHFEVDHKNCPIYQDISDGISPSGIEYYLPLFFDNSSTLFDYLPKETTVYTVSSINDSAEHFWRDAAQRYESLCGDIQRPILKPHEMFIPTAELFQQLKKHHRIQLETSELSSSQGNSNFACLKVPSNIVMNAKADNPLAGIENLLLTTNHRILFCVESAGRREALLDLLQRIDITPKIYDNWNQFIQGDADIAIAIAQIEHGFSLENHKITLIGESELFGARIQQSRRRKKPTDQNEASIRSLTELNIGSAVVHIEHGVGRYCGLETIQHGGETNEFLTLEYANGAKLYVPVASLNLISRYSGANADSTPLHKLGSDQWQKARKKAAEQIRDTAAELLDIYARRAARKGHQFPFPKEAYERFSNDFPFEETADQQVAIEAVCSDMISKQPMDRLVCGDVGFGKTEVAMRAAFIAAYNGKQVAMLVPTTLLAQQHLDNFRDRFADWPITIEVISRFRTEKEINVIEKKLAEGKVDIIIGTHKLLQSGLNYKNLGLLIIDEEHRFGVRQKEKLKSLRSEVDILTLTATPIPRTLNMAMSGIRDLSIIATPPAKRLSVKTFVREPDDTMIKDAILREILRGGQVYYLHNNVSTIERTAAELEKLIPEARIIIGHGQMRERQLEQVMSDFYHKRFNILVCTTIIETGIDIPNANTIIIDRADKFGLAQLHQLRGRVGRSHHQAYAYLLSPNKKAITGDAQKRLEAISSATDLGAGFTLATHDMEIRGAGELLGDDQSGQMHAVGFSLYMEMLDKAVKAIKQGKTPNLDQAIDTGIDINLRIPALIPEDFLPDVNTRLIMYKRISAAANDKELDELQVEMIDRFGLLPEPCKNLFKISSLKLRAQEIGIKKLEAGSTTGKIEFAAVTQVNPLTIVKLVQNKPQHFQLLGANTLKFTQDMDNSEARINNVINLLDNLSVSP